MKRYTLIDPVNLILNDLYQISKDFKNELNKDFEKNSTKESNQPDNGLKKKDLINYTPKNVSDNGDSYDIQIISPGFNKDEIEIELKNSILKVTGLKKEKSKNDMSPNIEYQYEMKEYFTHHIHIPDYVNTDDIKAKLENGVLNISLKINKPDIDIKKISID
jgi:HSP20 family protein